MACLPAASRPLARPCRGASRRWQGLRCLQHRVGDTWHQYKRRHIATPSQPRPSTGYKTASTWKRAKRFVKQQGACPNETEQTKTNKPTTRTPK